ncbi:MAG: cytochrome c maturation protein CcmE [Nitrospirota bacterium]
MKLGERASLRKIYIRWGILLIILGAIGVLGLLRYQKEVVSLSPAALLRERSDQVVRVRGTVVPGTLLKGELEVTFDIEEGKTRMRARYIGKDDDNLRELKLLVLEGVFDPGGMVFSARKILVNPHYGFVLAAYLISILPLAFFLFSMERKMILLSILIKEEKAYQPEAFDSGKEHQTPLLS